MSMKNNSPHILNTSATLLRFCLLVLTSIKVAKLSEVTIIDEATGIATILLMISTLFSFLSMRSKNLKKSENFESIADYGFFWRLSFSGFNNLLSVF